MSTSLGERNRRFECDIENTVTAGEVSVRYSNEGRGAGCARNSDMSEDAEGGRDRYTCSRIGTLISS